MDNTKNSSGLEDLSSSLNSGSSLNTGSGLTGGLNTGSSLTGSSLNTGTERPGMITGLFRDRQSAESAYSSLSGRGYSKDDINLLMSDDTRRKHFGNTASDNDSDLGNKAMEGAGVGSAIGGTLGGVIGAIAAIGTAVALPGIGLVVAGPLAAGLAGAGAGGLTGGLVGALVGSGIPEDRAKHYEEGIKGGGILMGINPRSREDADFLESEWRKHQAQDIRS